MKMQLNTKDIIAINSNKLNTVLPDFKENHKQINGLEIELNHPMATWVTLGKILLSQITLFYNQNDRKLNVDVVAFHEYKNEIVLLDEESTNYLEKYLSKYYSSQKTRKI